MSITVENLTVEYGGNVVLDGLSLTIDNGQFFTLLGPSGCGKTTLLRTIAGFLPAVKGQIRFGGRDVTRVPAYQRDIGMVFQDYALFPNRTVFENVAYGLRARKVSESEIKARVGDALERVGLTSFFARLPAALSGGQRQRVALARALVIKPQVLLMDEPLSNLDAKLRVQIRETIRALQQETGITTVFVTHDQEEALVMADRIAVMDRGQIIQIGSGEDIYRNPVSRFVASFIGDANLIPVNVNGLVDESLMIRPEDVMLGSNADGTFHGASMDVASTLFIGNAQRIYGTLENGAEFVVQVPAHSHSILPKAGERIEVHWPIARERRLSQ